MTLQTRKRPGRQYSLQSFIAFSLTILTAFTACKKDEKLDVSSFSNCSAAQNLDSASISAKLIGSWVWSKRACFWTGTTQSANKNIKVTFGIDHTFSVNENAATLTQGTWKLIQEPNVAWHLSVSSPSEYLEGRILFCEKQLLLNDSYRDGCDNLFNKIN